MADSFSSFSAALREQCPEGVYISLKPGSPLQWSGVLFVRRGPYAPAILRFQLSFPQDYPYLPPTIAFITDVFHPLVTPLTTYTYTTGSLNSDTVSATDEERLPPGGFILRHGFPNWIGRAGKSNGSSALSSRDISRSHARDSPLKALQEVRPMIDRGDNVTAPQYSMGSTAFALCEDIGRDDIHVSVVDVLEYVKQAFSEETLLDSVPLGAAGNPGAWKAWRAYRASSSVSLYHDTRIAEGPDDREEWNWDGVWEQRVQKGIDTSISDAVLYGGTTGGDDMIRFVDVDQDLLADIKGEVLAH